MADKVVKNLQDLERVSGLTGRQIADLAKQFKGASKDAGGFGHAVEEAAHSLQNLGSMATKAFSLLGANVGFKSLQDSALKYDKALFSINRTAKATGQSFKELERSIDTINKTTRLSRQESASLVTTMQKGVAGIKMTGDEIAKYAQTMSSEFGSSAEDINKATQNMIDMQRKNVSLFKDLAKGMDDDSFQDYLYFMEDFLDISDEQSETLIRSRSAFQEQGKQLDEEAKKLRELADSVQDVKKGGEDLELLLAQELKGTFIELNKFITSVTGGIQGLVKEFPLLVKGATIAAASLGALMTAWAGIKAVKGISSVVGGLFGGGGKGGGGGLGGGLKGMASSALGLGGGSGGGSAVDVFVTNWGDAGGGGSGGGDQGPSGTEVKSLFGKARGLLNKYGNTALGKTVAVAGLAATAYGAYQTLSSESASNENAAALNKQDMGERAFNSLNPVQGGKNIGTAARIMIDPATWQGMWQSAKGWWDPKGEATKRKAEMSAFQAKLAKSQQENGAAAAMAAAGVSGAPGAAGAEAPKEAEATKEAAKQQETLNTKLNEEDRIRKTLVAKLQLQKMVTDMIIQSNQAQIEYATKYENNIGKASDLLKQSEDQLKRQITRQQQIYDLTVKDVDAKMAKYQVELEGAKTDDERTAAMEKIERLSGLEAKHKKNLIDSMTQLQQTQEQASKLYDEQIATQQSQTGLLEAQYNMTKSIYMGLGPQLDMQQKIVDSLESEKQLLMDSLKAAKLKLAADQNSQSAKQRVLSIEQKIVAAEQKQLDITKNLREGFLDAMSAFTNAEGSFAKIITKQDQSAGEMVRRFGAASTARAGGKGGLDNPYAKYEAGTAQLSFAGQGEMDQLMKSRGLGDLQSRGMRATPMSAMSGMSDGQKDAATNGPASIQSLNEQMPDHVKEGTHDGIISAYKEMGIIAKTDKSTKAVVETAQETKKANQEDKKAKDGTKKQDAKKEKEGTATGLTTHTLTDPDADFNAKVKQVKADAAEFQRQIDSERMGGRNITDVQIGRAGHGTGMAGGGRGKGPRMSADAIASAKRAMRGDIDTKGWAEQGRVNRLRSDREYATKIHDKIDKEQGAGTSNTRRIGMPDALYNKYKTMGGKDENWQSAKAMIMATEKTAKNTADTNKTLEKSRQDGKQTARDMQASMGKESLNSTLQGFGGGGALGLDMGSSPTDFGLGAIFNSMMGSMFGGLGFAEGGTVPGIGNSDSQPAMLMPGEFVVRKEMATRFAPILKQMNENKYAMGGFVGPSPAMARGGGGGGSPNISISVRGDSVHKITKSVQRQLSGQLEKMLVPSGTTGRNYELSQ